MVTETVFHYHNLVKLLMPVESVLNVIQDFILTEQENANHYQQTVNLLTSQEHVLLVPQVTMLKLMEFVKLSHQTVTLSVFKTMYVLTVIQDSMLTLMVNAILFHHSVQQLMLMESVLPVQVVTIQILSEFVSPTELHQAKFYES